MSTIHNLEEFKKVVGEFKCCPGLQKLINDGMIRIDIESVDEKGYGYCVTLIGPKFKEIWIPHCPCCGKKIFNVMVPEGECTNPELPRMCKKHNRELEPSPDGPWCRECDPDMMARFHAGEDGPHD